MSVDIKEQRKKDKKDEVILVGRNLAWIKKKNPELYDFILKKAEEEGLTASDILEKAIKYTFMERESILESLSAREFLVMIDKWNELQTRFLKNLLDYVTMFFKMGFEKYTEIINAISESIKEEASKTEESKGKKKIDVETLLPFISGLTTSIPQIISSVMNITRELTKIPSSQELVEVQK